MPSTVMKAPERFETARLSLSRPERKDAEAIFARYASDPEVTRFLGWPRHTSVAETHAWGQGYATEALAGIIRITGDLGLRRLSALCHPDHRASQHVLEKCGFVRDHTWSQQIEFPNLAPGLAQDVAYYELRPRRTQRSVAEETRS